MAAYRPGQGIVSGSADKLRARKEASEFCEVCGERTEEGGLNCASVDDSKQWKGLLGEGTGSRKKARCSECTKPLPEDHDLSLGAFCAGCFPKYGQGAYAPPAPEKSTEVVKQAPDENIQFGHLVRPGICNRCKDERRLKENEEARGKKLEREQAKAQALDEGLEAPERVSVSLSERPFGMTPSKNEGAGYLVVKTSDGKPAARAGIRPGWRVAEVGSTSCEGMDLEQVQALLKAADLPAAVVFEAVPNGGDFCTACHQILVWALFSRKMRTKPAETRRCTACVGGAGAEGEPEEAKTASAGAGRGSGGYGGGGRGKK